MSIQLTKEMSEVRLCKSIRKMFAQLPIEERVSIRRVYDKTCLIVDLQYDGMVRPTKACHSRLEDLYHVLDRELIRRTTAS